LKSFDAKRVSVITHIINKLFDTDPERIYYSTYIDMIKIYNNLSDDVQELEEIKNILNPYPDAWYNKEYFPLVKDSQNTQSMYKIIEDKATLVNKKLSELSNDLHFSPYSNFTT
jgi:site-specific DNA-adenine methylase